MAKLLSFSKNDILLILFLWICLSAININKAYHIDDTFHLEAAKWIQNNPLTPLSGEINWSEDPEKIYHFNQPPLLFYFIALFGGIFNYNEITMHLFLSIFTFFALVFFKKSCQKLNIQNSNALLIIFAFCPAFVVNQNLMTDVPILCLELGFCYHFILYFQNNKSKHLIHSMLFLSAAVLIKYSLIPLILASILILVAKKNRKHILFAFIPVGFLALWSLWNLIEYGGNHMMERPKNEMSLHLILLQIVAYISCIGSILPITLFIYRSWLKSKTIDIISIAFALAFIVFTTLVYKDYISIPISTSILNALFITSGSLILIRIIQLFAKDSIQYFKKLNQISIPSFLGLCFAGLSAFMILFAPFIATRHILLILPFILLLLAPYLEANQSITKTISIASCVFLGIVLGISDWVHADFYRSIQKSIPEHKKENTWSAGHWGWQWYSLKNEMKFYAKTKSSPNEGDLYIYPKNASKQVLNEAYEQDTIGSVSVPYSPLTFFSGLGFASLYNSYSDKPAWEFSKAAPDTIMIVKLKIKKVPLD